MSRFIRFLLVSLWIALAGTGGYLLRDALYEEPGQGTPQVFTQAAALIQGQPRPAFVLPDLQGAPRDVKVWDGKVLVLNFWATWCPPCRDEIPGFIELQTNYGDRGLQIVGVAIDELRATTEYAMTMGINYPLLVGDSDAIEVAKSYGNHIGALPYTVVIDRSGRIAFVKHGELSKEEAEKAIRALL